MNLTVNADMDIKENSDSEGDEASSPTLTPTPTTSPISMSMSMLMSSTPESPSWMMRWFQSFAIFGNSTTAMVLSFLLFALSIIVSWWIEHSSVTSYAEIGMPMKESYESNNRLWSLLQTLFVSWPFVSGTFQHKTTTTTTSTVDLSVEEAYHQLDPIPDWFDPMETPKIWNWKEENDNDEQDNVNINFNTSFWNQIQQEFHRDGVVAIRGLVDPTLLHRLDQASQRLVDEQYQKRLQKQQQQQQQQQQKELSKPKGALTGMKRRQQGTQFYTVQEGALFWGLNTTHHQTIQKQQQQQEDNTGNSNSSNSSSSRNSDLSFLDVAMGHTKIPEIIATKFLNLTASVPSNDEKSSTNSQTLRLMRDIFLAKDNDEYICGWHVDDTGFWPAEAEAPGVNVWIALDDMPVAGGGGFAVAVGSHTASWRQGAYQVTGSTHTFPKEGFTSARDTVERRVGSGTCNIATAAPHLHRRMEETKRVYDVKRGDIIFHTRWLFHRTVPFEKNNELQDLSHAPRVYRRYSIRYGPGTSIIPKGYGTEPSVLWDDSNGGRTADEIASYDLAWYPQVWPSILPTEYEQLETIATVHLPEVLKKKEARHHHLRMARRSKFQAHHQPH